MKQLVTVVSFLFILLFHNLVYAAQKEILLVTEDAAAPYMISINNKADGIYPRIIMEANKRLPEYNITIKAMPWKRALREVERGAAHGVIGTFYKPHKRPWIKHFSKPYFVENVTIFCRNGIGKKEWVYPYDYAGLKFGNNRGYETPGPEFFNMVEMGRIRLETANDTETNLRKLRDARIDCYVNDAVQVEIKAKLHKIDGFERVGVFRSETSHVGFGRAWVSSYSHDFIQELDRVIVQMHEDGTISDIFTDFLSKLEK